MILILFQLNLVKMYFIVMKSMYISSIILFVSLQLFASNQIAGSFTMTRVQYSGGGDWYSDPSSIPNLLEFVSKYTNIAVNMSENRAKIGSDNFFNSYYLYLTGHGNINFTDNEAQTLRNFLLNGGFLHADDNYGMDKAFRREMKKVFLIKNGLKYQPITKFLIFIINSKTGYLKFISMMGIGLKLLRYLMVIK